MEAASTFGAIIKQINVMNTTMFYKSMVRNIM